MMKEGFVNIPNLPEGQVCFAVTGDYPEITAVLNDLGIRTCSFRNENLSPEVSRHSDMLICHTGENRIFADPLQDMSVLLNEGFSVSASERLSEKYPLDVKLNTAVSGNYFICNRKTVDKSLFDTLIKYGKTPVFVNQGYTKCSVCFIRENAVITEDGSIYEALKKTDTDVLLISKGDIYLSEKHHGFFGGCTGKTDRNTLAVTGELKYHRDGNKILEFCAKHSVSVKELTKGIITDIGGILPLKEMR